MQRTRISKVLSVALFLAAGVCLAADPKVAELLAKMPTDSIADGQKLMAELVQMGPGAVKEVCQMLVPPGTGDDAKVQFALNGLTMYVSRPDAEAERKMVADVFIESLGQASDNEVKAFLIRQIQLVGKEEAIAPLSRLLADERLCDPAARALVTLGTPAAVVELAKALPTAQGKNLATILNAVAGLRVKEAAGEIAKHTSDPDVETRRLALYALANLGDPSSGEVLAKAAQAPSFYERAKATSYCLLYAQRLAESGQKDACAKICRELIQTRTAPREGNVPCAAMSVLVTALGKDAVPDLLAALDGKDKKIREAALMLLCVIPGEDVTAKCVEKMEQVSTEARVEAIAMLGRRGDKSAMPTLIAALKNADASVRLAAIPAAAQLGGNEAVPALLTIFDTDQADDIKAAQEALKLLPGEEPMVAVAGALPKAPPRSRVALLEILAARRAKAQAEAVFTAAKDEDRTVRREAIKTLGDVASEKDLPRLVDLLLNAGNSAERSAAQKSVAAAAKRIPDPEKRADTILAAVEKATGDQRGNLLRVLAQVGGRKALQTVLAEAKSADEALKDAAVRALSEWEDVAAAPELLNVARTSENTAHQVLALRGYVRLAGTPKLSPEQKVQMLKDAMAAAKRSEEKKLVLGGLGEVRTIEALALAAPCLDDPALQTEAALAVAKIACPHDKNDQGLTDPAVAAPLRKAIGFIKDENILKQAREHLGAIPVSDELDLALRKPVKASVGQEGDKKPELAVDGDSKDLNSAWFGRNWPASLEIDLEKTAKIDTVAVYFYWDGARYYQYTIEVSPDGKTWKTVADNSKNTTPATPKGVAHTFPPEDARYVRVNVLKNSANQAIHLVEVKVYAPGTAPAPPPPPKADAEGFIPLVLDKELTGWTGSTKGYDFENGVLVCDEKRGGMILTEKEYADFVIRFDFKLSPGGNNGLAIRTPLGVNPAYGGMEIQILDNRAEKHAKLQPYQYHGSIYGVVPAKREFQNPVGDWNSEEVTAKGPHITVILNGTTIVDADISKIEKPEDGKEHPGLTRTQGHVGFMGHGSRVEFRNIRIKELK